MIALFATATCTVITVLHSTKITDYNSMNVDN